MSFLPHHSIANIIILSNITFGTLSLLHSIRGHYTTAAAFILIVVFLDGMDGRVARRLSVSSELGKQLDSLCDLVFFGVAPAFLIYLQYTVVYSFEFGVVLTARISMVSFTASSSRRECRRKWPAYSSDRRAHV